MRNVLNYIYKRWFSDASAQRFQFELSYSLVIFRILDPDPDPDWIRIQSGQWIRIRIRIHEGKNDPQK
jgi:hypothetical protein